MSSKIVLNYPGPFTWSSHKDTIPVLKEIWTECGAEIIDVWHPINTSVSNEFKKIISSDVLVFPLGQQQNNAMASLCYLRKIGWNGHSLIMIAGEGILKYRQLSSNLNYLSDKDTFIFNSSREKEVFRSHFSDQFNTCVIPLPINEKIFNCDLYDDRDSIREDFKILTSDKVILFAGRVSTQKNIVSLLTILNMLRETDNNWKLIIAGSYDDLGVPYMENSKAPYLYEINYWMNHLKLKDSVRFLDSLEPRELSRLMSASDVYLSATLHCSEDFGLSVSQAVSMKVPCLTTYWGGGVDFIDKGQVGKIPVFYTENGLKIDYRSAYKSALQAINTRPVLENYFSNKNIKDKWSNLIEGNFEPTINLKPSQSSIDLSGKDFFKCFSLSYGALAVESIKPDNFYLNPHWVESSKHLFDPLAFKRSFPDHFDSKKMGIELPDLS